MKEQNDRLMQDLACLHPIAPNPFWEERVRSRCHAKIAQSGPHVPHRSRLIDAAAIVALCVYLTAVLQASARLAGLL